jgi:hypothetical protein
MINAKRKWPPGINAPAQATNQPPIRSQKPPVVQPKIAAPQPTKTPVPPPVYRPQPLARVLQTKTAIPHATQRPLQPKPLDRPQPGSKPSAPTVYRPQPTPKCLQLKAGTNQSPSAAQRKPPPPIAANIHVRTAQGTLQAKRAETRAAAPASKSANALGKGPQRAAGNPSGRSSVIQRWITWDANSLQCDRDGDRPSGHLNVGVLTEILEDIINKGALTAPEDELLTLTIGQQTAKAKAQEVRKAKLLSVQGFAICHKIPYAGFEKALLALIDGSRKHGIAKYSHAWDALEALLHVLEGTTNGSYNYNSGLKNAVAQNSPNDIVAQANSLLAQFDKCDANLYVGFSMTNSSIGENADLHYRLLNATSNQPATATPRGQNIKTALNTLETLLGVPKTVEIKQVDQQQVTWSATSGVYGKISAGTGFVATP